MESPAATETVSRPLDCHRICIILLLCAFLLLIVYEKTSIALYWFIWEGLLLIFLIVRRLFMIRATTWHTIWLLLLIFLWYLFLFADHVFLRLSVSSCDISHLFRNDGFLKMMIHYFLFRLLLFVIIEGLVHSADDIISGGLLPREEFFLRHIVRLHGGASSGVLVSSCLLTTNTVIISCVVLMAAIYEEFWLGWRSAYYYFSPGMLSPLMNYFLDYGS